MPTDSSGFTPEVAQLLPTIDGLSLAEATGFTPVEVSPRWRDEYAG
jgi:hypothetical protein